MQKTGGEQKRIGLIRVLTTEDPALLNCHAKIIMTAFPSLCVESSCIPDQSEGIYDDATEKKAVPKIIDLAQTMQKQGSNAVIISCAGDPAVGMLQQMLSVPVIGAGSAAATLALACGKKVGVLGLTSEAPLPIRHILRDLFVTNLVPEGVSTTLDLLRPEGKTATIIAAKRLCDAGAEVLLLACTGMSTIGVAEDIRRTLSIPVIDPVRAEASLAWAICG